MEVQGAHEIGGAPYRGGAPLSRGQALGPWCISFADKFLLIPKSASVDFHFENFSFLHIKQHHGSPAENSVSPG